MTQYLRNLLKPPTFDNEQLNHQAYLLNIILMGLLVVPVPYLLYTLASPTGNWMRAFAQGGASFFINIFLLYLLRRGFVRSSAIFQVIAFWAFFTVSAWTGVGVQGESYLLGYPLVIIIAGILLGGRAALSITVISLFTGLLMLSAQTQGVIKSDEVRPPLMTWVVSSAIFIMSAVLQTLSSRTVNQALKRAQTSEEKYRLISRVSSDYAFESRINEDGAAETFWVAGAFEQMTGYTPKDYFEAGGWYAHIHPDDLQQDEEDMRKLSSNQPVVGSEIRTRSKSGEIRWERVYAHPIWSDEENRLVGILGAVQDVTAQKEAEAKLKDTLHQQDAILNNIPDMAWMKDLQGNYIAVNDQFLTICGLQREDVIGKTDFEIWQPAFSKKYRLDDLEVIQSGKRKTMEETQRDGYGQEYWVETTKTPIRNEHGEVIGTTGIARNVTERKNAEIERERFIAELGKKNAELERFTYTVSHDLKSPLVTITGFLGYIERDVNAGKFENFTRDIQRVRQAVDRMQALLNDLLELSRIGRIVNPPVETDFSEIVREALAMLEGAISAKKVNIQFHEENITVIGDKVRLVEVMQNLIENAIKFMGTQPAPTVQIGTKRNEAGQTIFFVQDNGIGIDPEYQDRIFGLFNKLDSTTIGTGIGLTLVKRIIEVHNGNIWLESEPGQGTIFFFTLPIH